MDDIVYNTWNTGDVDQKCPYKPSKPMSPYLPHVVVYEYRYCHDDDKGKKHECYSFYCRFVEYVMVGSWVDEI
jgi:hypothetical protein